MGVAITPGTITWGVDEIKNQCMAKGIAGAEAGYIDAFIRWFTGSTAFPALDRNAGLILGLHNIIRPLIDVAKACWGTYGTAGTTAATVAQVVTFIKTLPSWEFDSNVKVYRPDISGPVATIIGTIIHSFLADAAAADFTQATYTSSGALLSAKMWDDKPDSPTFGTFVVLTKDQYARALYSLMGRTVKIMRYFAVGLLDDTKGAGSSEIG